MEELSRCTSKMLDEAVALVVTDTGIGIDPVALASLGQPFQQADASIGRRFGGSGLGLAISRKLLALHGGTLTIESTLGQGHHGAGHIPTRADSRSTLQRRGHLRWSPRYLPDVPDKRAPRRRSIGRECEKRGQLSRPGGKRAHHTPDADAAARSQCDQCSRRQGAVRRIADRAQGGEWQAVRSCDTRNGAALQIDRRRRRSVVQAAFFLDTRHDRIGAKHAYAPSTPPNMRDSAGSVG